MVYSKGLARSKRTRDLRFPSSLLSFLPSPSIQASVVVHYLPVPEMSPTCISPAKPCREWTRAPSFPRHRFASWCQCWGFAWHLSDGNPLCCVCACPAFLLPSEIMLGKLLSVEGVKLGGNVPFRNCDDPRESSLCGHPCQLPAGTGIEQTTG